MEDEEDTFSDGSGYDHASRCGTTGARHSVGAVLDDRELGPRHRGQLGPRGAGSRPGRPGRTSGLVSNRRSSDPGIRSLSPEEPDSADYWDGGGNSSRDAAGYTTPAKTSFVRGAVPVAARGPRGRSSWSGGSRGNEADAAVVGTSVGQGVHGAGRRQARRSQPW